MGGCGRYFLNTAWKTIKIRNVTPNTSRSRLSAPGSCCGFLYSAKGLSNLSIGPADRMCLSDLLITLRQYRVISRPGKGMTTQKAQQSYPSASHDAVAINRLHRILGTCRHIAAGRGQHRRDGPLVGPEQVQRDEFGDLVQERLAFGVSISGFGPHLA